MEMIKKIALKIGLLVMVLVGINIIYINFFFENDLQEHSPIINDIRLIPSDADIIYLGESSNASTKETDTDKRAISQLIGSHFPNLKVYDITKNASHSGIYKYFLENVAESEKRQTVIVTLNLRSFNSQWINSNLETPLQKSNVLLKPHPPIINRFLLSFKAYEVKTDKEWRLKMKNKWRNDIFDFPYEFSHPGVIEWDQATAKIQMKNDLGEVDFAVTELACHYVKAYGFQIDTLTNPRIKDFNDIVDLAKKRNWNLVFNLLAENTEKADKLLGKDLTFMMNSNADILMKYYERKGVLVVNNLNEVRDEQFIDQNWTTEHYDQYGRITIANNVAKEIQRYYRDEYTP